MSAFEDRMSGYDTLSDLRAERGGPIVVRLDGKSFSKYTRGMDRPFDVRLAYIMNETTSFLVKETGAQIGYTGSDEITIILYNKGPQSEHWFGGRLMKISSLTAAMTTAYFNSKSLISFPDKPLTYFDARAYSVPSIEEAINQLQWRQGSVEKNAVSMAAQHYFSAKKLIGVNNPQKIQMLAEIGVTYSDYALSFRMGTYYGKNGQILPNYDVRGEGRLVPLQPNE